VLQKTASWLRVPDETTPGRLFKAVCTLYISEMEALVYVLRKVVWQKAVRSGASQVAALQGESRTSTQISRIKTRLIFWVSVNFYFYMVINGLGGVP